MTMTREKPILALVPGDPTGIGPELTAKVLASGQLRDVADFLVVGDRHVM